MGLRRPSPGEVVSPLVNAAPVKEATLQAEEPLPRNVEALSCGVLPAKRVSDLVELAKHTRIEFYGETIKQVTKWR